MATMKQRSTARRNLGKARKTNTRKRTITGRVAGKVRAGVRKAKAKVRRR